MTRPTGNQVGWYCIRCEAVRPMNHQLCRCLDGTQSLQEIDQHQANYWYPAYVGVREPKRMPNATA